MLERIAKAYLAALEVSRAKNTMTYRIKTELKHQGEAIAAGYQALQEKN